MKTSKSHIYVPFGNFVIKLSKQKEKATQKIVTQSDLYFSIRPSISYSNILISIGYFIDKI
jgi:hypothetical protein